MYFWPNTSNTAASNQVIWVDLTPAPEPTSPLRRVQVRLQDGRLWWLGNRVSDLRCWLWKLCR